MKLSGKLVSADVKAAEGFLETTLAFPNTRGALLAREHL
jgi:hypothetical protein